MPLTQRGCHGSLAGMDLRTPRRPTHDGAMVASSPLPETRGDPAKRRPTAHLRPHCGRAEPLARAALRRLAPSSSRVGHEGLEIPPTWRPPAR
jgi:hypothetical protein